MNDYKGAARMLKALPRGKAVLADKGYDVDWFRDAIAERKITAFTPSRATGHSFHEPRNGWRDVMAFISVFRGHPSSHFDVYCG